MFDSAGIAKWCVPMLNNQKVRGSNGNPIHLQNSVLAISELSTNCTIAWMVDRQDRTILYSNGPLI